jgi:hypothetical protein
MTVTVECDAGQRTVLQTHAAEKAVTGATRTVLAFVGESRSVCLPSRRGPGRPMMSSHFRANHCMTTLISPRTGEMIPEKHIAQFTSPRRTGQAV